MRIRYENRRTLVTLSGTQRLRLKIRRCEAEGCARFRKPYRPEAEGALALPRHEFGLDVMALVAGPPRTNNALEQPFGSQRYHERRATGRKTASPGAVLRGPVRLVAGIGTRARVLSGRDLGRVDRARWRDLRRSLDHRRQARVARTRFRRDPDAYLTALERQAQQQTLPS